MKKMTLLMLLAAMNLRLSVTALPPLFHLIQQDLIISKPLIALLVTIPLLCFGAGSLLAPRLIQELGIKTMLLLTTGLLILANLIRPFNVFTLISGTFLVGLAIAGLNITVPTMIAQMNQANPTRLTSDYSLVMTVVAAIGTAVALPLASRISWQAVMALFALPAVITWLCTYFLLPQATRPTKTPHPSQHNLLAIFKHDRQVQKLALFMGGQSLIFYTLVTWLPTIYQAIGATSTEAGTLFAVFQFIGVPAAALLNIFRSQRQTLRWLLVGYSLGFACLAWSGIGWWLSALILGLTCALMFSFALNLIATSSRDTTTITNRSAIAQAIGYLLAAIGPVLIGQLQNLTQSWLIPILSLVGLMLLTILIGFRTTND
ncbi:MFS transporter [Lactiplantibacillus sp. WILCCON 0030]|uniref:MFS transporter n=1 Tax=Lactiplantibacillus brownii TaxID=3069269 RepID=A0ABU1ABM1_9LACO|nr:MFS transporter [Lactiplantibacillus brownii]MDQ7938369.1 MFS transporter [Lactiplantibacillus brownii]